MRQRRRYLAIACGCILAWIASDSARAGRLEKDLRARWRGAWVVIATESHSRCDGRYTENLVHETRVSAAGHRFAEGELGKVDQVHVRRERVELHVALEVPRLVPFADGPFTLYRERDCRLSLDVKVPREAIKGRDVDAVQERIERVVASFPSRQAAIDAGAWNGRETEPYPEDYEETLVEHATWVAEQTNLALEQKRAQALGDAADLARAIETDGDYLRGLAAGTRALKGWSPRDCGQLLDRDFRNVRRKVRDEDEANPESWHRGYEDGQRLVYSLVVLEWIDGCYVPVPATDAG